MYHRSSQTLDCLLQCVDMSNTALKGIHNAHCNFLPDPFKKRSVSLMSRHTANLDFTLSKLSFFCRALRQNVHCNHDNFPCVLPCRLTMKLKPFNWIFSHLLE